MDRLQFKYKNYIVQLVSDSGYLWQIFANSIEDKNLIMNINRYGHYHQIKMNTNPIYDSDREQIFKMIKTFEILNS